MLLSLGVPYVDWFTRKVKRINRDFEHQVAYEMGALGTILLLMCEMRTQMKHMPFYRRGWQELFGDLNY